MSPALDRPALSSVFAHWTVQPVAIVLAAVLVLGYARGLAIRARSTRRLPPWPRYRTWLFGFGVALMLWTSCGFAGAYADSLYWVWTSQTLMLWLGVPIVILSGHPVQLAQQALGPGNRIDRAFASRPVRVLGNPLVGPALVPLLSFVLFFGPVAGWAISSRPTEWVVQLLLLAIGAVMVIPLVGLDEEASSLAVGFSLAIGSFELVIDAVPGIALRLHHGLATAYFDHRIAHPWSPSPMHDQTTAGGILWCIAELIDMPFLVLVYRRWLRADARDAARIDAVLSAERAARRGLQPDPDHLDPDDHPPVSTDLDEPFEVERDQPWWLNDPAMQRRLRRRD